MKSSRKGTEEPKAKNREARHIMPGFFTNDFRTWYFLDPGIDPSLAEVNPTFVQSIAGAAHNGVRLIVESQTSAGSGEWSRECIAQKTLAVFEEENITTGEVIIREAEEPSELLEEGVVVRIENEE